MSVQDITFQAAGTVVTADGTSGTIDIPTMTMLDLVLDVTAASGTSPTLDAWLEGSADDGSTWSAIPCDSALEDSAAVGAGNTPTGRQRNANAAQIDTVERHMAEYKHIAYDKVRLQWAVGGATPSFTWSARARGK